MRIYSKLACFIGGALFGSVGIKLLSSKDAKKAYTHITAAGLRMKDSAMKTVATVQENAGDILASAKDINEMQAEAEGNEPAPGGSAGSVVPKAELDQPGNGA